MSNGDYLTSIESDFQGAEIDTPTYLFTGALLGIGQQLRRIADAMPRPRPTLDKLDDNMATYSAEAKDYASGTLSETGQEPWDIEDVWDAIAAAYDDATHLAVHS